MIRAPRRRLISGVAIAWAVLAGAAQATELVYTPVNPSFGGNPNNAPGLLANANAQNPYRAPVKSNLQIFKENLQRAILNRLTTQTLTSLFGKNSSLVPGSYDTGAYTVTITDLGNGTLKVDTTDKTTGAVVSFEVGTTSLDTATP